MKHLYTPLFRKFTLPLFLIFSGCLFGTFNAHAQYTLMDWGAYFSDSTYSFRDTADEYIEDIALDHSNPENIYIVGSTKSSDSIFIPCPGDTLFYGGKGDAFLAKYDRCGTLQWSRYLGDSGRSDHAYAVAIDTNALGHPIIYMAGEMKTNGRRPRAIVCDGGPPVFDKKPVGTWDGFISKYDENGNLQRYTYFGGTDPDTTVNIDQILTILIHNHQVFVGGFTQSTDLQVGALIKDDSTYNRGGDGFLAMFSPQLDTLKYFTYVGGRGQDRVHDIKIYNPPGSRMQIFLDGTTESDSLAMGTGFDTTLGGTGDAFVGKWEDTSGTGKFQKIWLTYLGGEETERGRDMDLDDQGNIIVGGQTHSDSLLWCKGYDSTYNGGTDGFVVKIPNAGGPPMWGTYFGGYGDDDEMGMIYKHTPTGNHIIITGITNSSQNPYCLPNPNPHSFPVYPLKNPLQNYMSGDTSSVFCPTFNEGDAFVAELTDTTVGQSLIFSTFIGGSDPETNGNQQFSYSPSLALAKTGELYIALNTKSNDIKKSLGRYMQTKIGTFLGGVDGFLARLINVGDLTQTNCKLIYDATSAPLNNTAIAVYPNPSNQLFNVSVEAAAGKMQYLVYDNLGRLILNEQAVSHEGQNIYQIDLSRQPGGMYFLKIICEEKIYTAKLMKE